MLRPGGFTLPIDSQADGHAAGQGHGEGLKWGQVRRQGLNLGIPSLEAGDE